MLEGMLLAPILRPLIAGAGIVGEYELDLLAHDVADRDRSGFAALVADRLGKAP
jgi:hypothetical protein